MTPAGRELRTCVSGVRAHLRRRARLAAGLWLAGGTVLLLIVAWVASGSDGWSQGSNVPAYLDASAMVLLGISVWVFRRCTAKWFGEEPLSAAMEGAGGLSAGILRGTLELSRATPPGVSASLASKAVLATVQELQGRTESELAGTLGDGVSLWTRRGFGFATTFAAMLTALTIAAPGRTVSVIAGVVFPISTMIDPAFPPLVVMPGDAEVLRGTDAQVVIAAVGRLGVELAWQAAGDIARTEALTVREGSAAHVFRTVSAPIEYRAEGDDGSESATYRIVPVDPLFVSDLVMTVEYPPYTGLTADEYRGDPPPMRLPIGSAVTFAGVASRRLSSVQLNDSLGSLSIAFEIDDYVFQGRWMPVADGLFEWDFRDLAGAPAESQPEPLEVMIIPDLSPVVSITVPGRDTILPLNLRQPVLIEAGDDYGLRRVELVVYRVSSFGERGEPAAHSFDTRGQLGVLARPLLDLSSWGLVPGDTVRYYARAVDNSPAGQVAVSEEHVLRMPEAAELQRRTEGALEGVAERLEELAAEAARQAEENRDQALKSAARRSEERAGGGDQRESEFEEREELRSALDIQERLSSEVDSLRSEVEALQRMMEEAGQADPDLRRQLDELQDLLSQMTGYALIRRMEGLADALERKDMNQANQSLTEMAAEQDRFRERLQESLERFKRAVLEQDFRATTSEAEELARKERALADAMMEDDGASGRAEQQQDIAAQAEQLVDHMVSLQKRLNEVGKDDAAKGVEVARKSTVEAIQQMENTRERAEQEEVQAASEEANEAAEMMERAAGEMQQAMAAMAEQEMEAHRSALVQTADDALSLARRQSELRDQMHEASSDQLVQIRSAEVSLLHGVQNVAENLQLATEAKVGVNPELSAQMGRAMESLRSAVETMEIRPGSNPSPLAQAERAIGDLNQLAMMAIASAEQMGQQGIGQGGEEVTEQLAQLAQQQGKLMNQSTQLMPMQLGYQAMSRQVQEISHGQESVASDLGDLADEAGAEEVLGDLQALAEEAKHLAEQMAQGRLTPEIVRRQERLFHRLLDAGRSLAREELSEARESEVPGPFARGAVTPLTDRHLGVMPYEVPDSEQLRPLSPAIRRLVLEYFERINRVRSGAGGS